MTILTSRELEVLVGLRMSWGKLYSKEITRLQNEDDFKLRGRRTNSAHFPARADADGNCALGRPAVGNAAVDLEQCVLTELEDRTTAATGREPRARTCEPHRGRCG